MKADFLRNRFLDLIILMVAVSFFNISCEDTTKPRDITPPPVPTGLTSTTGDGVVWLEWDPIIGVRDLDGYSVYRSVDNSLFYWQSDTDKDITHYPDYDVFNGQTYYYGVSSFDYNGNESEVSFDYIVVFDTPRPQGWDVVIYTMAADPDYSGFDFSAEDIVGYNSLRADFYLEFDDSPGIDTYFITLGANGSGIQDMGHTESLFDITYAPDDGWSVLDYAEAIEGHTYVIRTVDDHYAMIRITDFDSFPARNMTFDWAYQIDAGNRELKIGVPSNVAAAPDSSNNVN
ncbi:MAG: HmuY family protein [Candidatus Zixiibacteriota bacterium]|nr:MAG: HmuY family protein [candidate division Zixibacteria bacterium]